MVSEDGESKDNESVILSCSVEESPLTSVEVRGIVDRVTPAAGKRNQHSEEDSVGMECGWKQVGDWEEVTPSPSIRWMKTVACVK